MRWPRKVALFGLFSLTVLIMIAATARGVVINGIPSVNYLESESWLYTLSTIEIVVGA